jgi:hypothetical protein
MSSNDLSCVFVMISDLIRQRSEWAPKGAVPETIALN